jgi:hypothetical protein
VRRWSRCQSCYLLPKINGFRYLLHNHQNLYQNYNEHSGLYIDLYIIVNIKIKYNSGKMSHRLTINVSLGPKK